MLNKEKYWINLFMSEIGTYSHNTPNIVYKLSEDIIVETCLDDSDPTNSRWRFKVQNVRVPIFADVCGTFISNRNLIDLGDGTNLNLLSTNIRNCLDLKRVLSDIDWQIRGPYSYPCEIHPTRYVFNEGIRAHEEKHYTDIIDEVKEELRDFAFPQLLNIFLYKDTYPCPNDALNNLDVTGLSKSQQIREFLFASIITQGANIKAQKGYVPVYCSSSFPIPLLLQYKSEVDADRAAIQTYREIRARILSWAKMQSWYDPTKPNCLGIN